MARFRWLAILTATLLPFAALAQADMWRVHPKGKVIHVQPRRAPAPLNEQSLPPPKTQEECAARVLVAERAGIFYGYGNDGIRPIVMVDEAAWNGLDDTVKVGMASTVKCAIVGPDQELAAPLEFRSHLTNKVIGEWDGTFQRLTVK
jgi:hypothetical protein